jgi:hypothetical protein
MIPFLRSCVPKRYATLAPRTGAGSGASNNGSMRTLPVNQSAGPLFEGCDPLLLISMLETSLLRVQGQHFSGIRSPVCAFINGFSLPLLIVSPEQLYGR